MTAIAGAVLAPGPTAVVASMYLHLNGLLAITVVLAPPLLAAAGLAVVKLVGCLPDILREKSIGTIAEAASRPAEPLPATEAATLLQTLIQRRSKS